MASIFSTKCVAQSTRKLILNQALLASHCGHNQCAAGSNQQTKRLIHMRSPSVIPRPPPDNPKPILILPMPPVGKDSLKSNANSYSGDLSKTFSHPEVKQIFERLQSIRIDVNKVFAWRREPTEAPQYKVLTEQKLREEERLARESAHKRLLLIPAVRTQRTEIDQVVSQDNQLIQFDQDGANYVFTDISQGDKQLGEVPAMRNRRIVLRENSTGVLREAPWDTRDKMEFMYYPREGASSWKVPAVLMDKYIGKNLSRLEHEYLLDYVNVQCEPDHPDYIRVYKRIYTDLVERIDYDRLQSTRHYPGFVHWMVESGRASTLAEFYIENARKDELAELARLDACMKRIISSGEESGTTEENNNSGEESVDAAVELGSRDDEASRTLVEDFLLAEGRADLIRKYKQGMIE